MPRVDEVEDARPTGGRGEHERDSDRGARRARDDDGRLLLDPGERSLGETEIVPHASTLPAYENRWV
jgi:hypothetical protein